MAEFDLLIPTAGDRMESFHGLPDPAISRQRLQSFYDGTLFYQGHRGQPGEPMVEGSTALFLTAVEPEGAHGYVATNTDPDNGHVTKYHVTPDQLVLEYTWSGMQENQPAV